MRGGKEEPKRQGPITKILSKADDVSMPFFPGKRTKRMDVSRQGVWLCFVPLMFYNSKGGEDYTTKLITSENLQPSV